jgi:hypothetical protein
MHFEETTMSSEQNTARAGSMAAWSAAALVSLATIAGCAGDDQLAGITGGGTGIASVGGTVTGYGSLIVDGVRWDDRFAPIEEESVPGQAPRPAEALLGQRVEIEYATHGVAERITLDAQVIGRIIEIAAQAGGQQLKVAGQTVRVNADPNAGPVTAIGGVTTLAELAVGEAIAVHGTTVFDSAAGRHVIVATRIDRLPTLPAALVRVAGTVTDYVPATGAFRIGELMVVPTSTTVIVPASRALGNGQRVIAWGAEPLAAGPQLNASFIRIRERPLSGAASELSGTVSRFNAADASFEMGGQPVNARSAIVVPANQSLADGRYVVVRGVYSAAGVLDASMVRIRRPDLGDVEVEVEGNITAYTSVSSFVVRGLTIDAAAVANRIGCPAALSVGLFVEITGSVDGNRVRAGTLRCKNPPAGSTLGFRGTVSGVDVAARRFTLTPASGPALAIRWTVTTAFVGGLQPGAGLDGRAVEVEVYAAAEYIAKKVKPGD